MDKKPADSYSSPFVFFYLFNLIVGVGVLNLPQAFNTAGLAIATVLIAFLCLFSYMAATFVTEAMAAANAYTALEEENKPPPVSYSTNTSKGDLNSDSNPLLQPSTTLVKPLDYGSGLLPPSSPEVHVPGPEYYEINKKFELGTMANMFFHPVGIFLYYFVMCLYLYGDLAIYAVTIPKSLTTVLCTTGIYNLTAPNETVPNQNFTECVGNLSSAEFYYIFLAIIALVLSPLAFFNLQKTKILQLITTVMRNVAFTLMFIIALYYIALGNRATPTIANARAFPSLFGVSVYSFMCQHSLPGMVTPMRSKRWLYHIMAADFLLVLCVYYLLSYTGAFWLGDGLNSLHSLDYFVPWNVYGTTSAFLKVCGYYLALFPVFTLSTSYPIICITLRENLKSLVHTVLRLLGKDGVYPFLVDKVLFPLVVVIPPVGIAYGTQNVAVLVSITGSYPGVCVQYLIPASLAFFGMRAIEKKYAAYHNKYRSPFRHWVFFVVLTVWSGVCIILVTVYLPLKYA